MKVTTQLDRTKVVDEGAGGGEVVARTRVWRRRETRGRGCGGPVSPDGDAEHRPGPGRERGSGAAAGTARGEEGAAAGAPGVKMTVLVVD